MKHLPSVLQRIQAAANYLDIEFIYNHTPPFHFNGNTIYAIKCSHIKFQELLVRVIEGMNEDYLHAAQQGNSVQQCQQEFVSNLKLLMDHHIDSPKLEKGVGFKGVCFFWKNLSAQDRRQFPRTNQIAA